MVVAIGFLVLLLFLILVFGSGNDVGREPVKVIIKKSEPVSGCLLLLFALSLMNFLLLLLLLNSS